MSLAELAKLAGPLLPVATAQAPAINLDNAVVDINGKRYRVVELLKLIVDKMPAR